MSGADQRVQSFLDRARETGLSVRPLSVERVCPSLHERAEGIRDWPVYRLVWSQRPRTLPGGRRLPGAGRASRRFVRVPREWVALPVEALWLRSLVDASGEAEEVAAFLDTDLQNAGILAVLAARVGGEWLELHRWRASWRELGLARTDVCRV